MLQCYRVIVVRIRYKHFWDIVRSPSGNAYTCTLYPCTRESVYSRTNKYCLCVSTSINPEGERRGGRGRRGIQRGMCVSWRTEAMVAVAGRPAKPTAIGGIPSSRFSNWQRTDRRARTHARVREHPYTSPDASRIAWQFRFAQNAM